MASWVLNFTKAGAKLKKQMPQQARQLLELGLWGVPPTAQAKEKIAVGDRALAYVGAPDRVFVGDAMVASGWHEWTPDEVARYPMTSTFPAGIALKDARVWNKPVPLSSVWPHTQGAKTNPSALWYGAAVRLTDLDFDVILAEGASTAPPPLAPPFQAQVGVGPAPGGGGGAVGGAVVPKPGAAADALPESEALFKVVTRLREFLHQAKSISEASTRAFFIDRYLDALGYTNFDDIEHGSAVQSGDYPDYVLRSAGKPVMAVEAKKIGQPLGPKESSQLVKYCSVLGLRWGVLTDGRCIQIYDAPLTGVAPEDRLVLEIDLNDWADREDFDVRRWPEAALITKQAMEDGEGLERFAARELIRSILVESGSKTLKALRVELQAKKVLLREAEIAELIRELLT